MNSIATEHAPRAIGPYSQAIEASGFLFTAGQIPLDPATMELLAGTIEDQVTRVLDNLEAILSAASLSFGDVVKTTVYLADMDDFPKMNGVYEKRFGSHRPARSTVGVAQLPKGARIEIDVIARRP